MSTTVCFNKRIDKRTEYLILGFIRGIQSLLQNQIIPIPIYEICMNFYPTLPRWITYNTELFDVSPNGLIIKGKNDENCSGYTVYPAFDGKNGDYSKGFNQGIHYFSVRYNNNKNSSNTICFRGIGFLTKDRLISHIDKVTPKFRNAYWDPCSHWDPQQIITVKLNCIEWTITYYSDLKQIYHGDIEKNETYYYAAETCASSDYCNFEIVSTPQQIYKMKTDESTKNEPIRF